jgi:cardiolipin synthase
MAVAAKRPGRHGTHSAAGDALTLTSSVYNLANALTLARLLAALPVVLLIQGEAWLAAFSVFLVAALTDVIDGWVAKRLAARSSVGAMLDPIADKLLLAGTFLALAKAGHWPVWLAGLIVLRDVLIVLGALIVRSRVAAFRIVPLAIGKLTTFVLLLAAGVVLGGLAGLADVARLEGLLVPTVAVLVCASGTVYLLAALRATGLAGARA